MFFKIFLKIEERVQCFKKEKEYRDFDYNCEYYKFFKILLLYYYIYLPKILIF